MRPRFRFLAVFALLLLSAQFHHGFAADAPGPVTPDIVKSKIEQLETIAGLDDETRTSLTEWYQKTLAHLDTARSHEAATEAFQQARRTAPAEAQKIRENIEKTAKIPPVDELDVSEKTPLPEIEQLLLKDKANGTAVEGKLGELEDQLSVQTDRPNAIRQEISAAVQRKEAISESLKLPPANETPLVAEARAWTLQSEDAAIDAEIQMLDQELLSQPMRIELLKAQRDKSALSLKRIGERIQLLEKTLADRRLAEAAQARVEAEREKRAAVGKHPVVRKLASQNAALSEELSSLTAELERVRTDEILASKEAKRIEEQFRRTKEKLALGLSEALGQVLLEQRRTLPTLRLLRSETQARDREIARTHLRTIAYEEQRRALRQIDDYVDAVVAGLPKQEAEPIRTELERLAKSRAELLDTAIDTSQALSGNLAELDLARRRLNDAVETHDELLAERLLWIRTSPAPTLQMLRAIPKQAAELLSPAHWFEVSRILAARATESPVLVFTLAVFGMLLWKTKQLRRALRATGKKIVKIRTDKFVFTLQAFGLTLLLAAPWPLLLLVCGWQLTGSPDATEFAKAVSRGLDWFAIALFHLGALRLLCDPGGLALAHFRWPGSAVKALRRALNRLMLVPLPTGFVTILLVHHDARHFGGELARAGIVIVLIALCIFFFRLFAPENGVLHTYVTQHPRSALAQLRYPCLAVLMAATLGLAGLALIGYTYTAATLTQSVFDTFRFIAALIVAHQLVIRWLLLTRRKLAFQAAVERREAARAAGEAKEALPAGDEGFADQVEEPAVDLETLSQDSRKLLNMVLDIVGIIGIWLIWSEVVPAFGFLGDIAVWDYMAVVAGEEQRVPVTMADAVVAVLIAVITVLATKRFPALLEIAVLQRLDMTSGGRYAATTLSSYAIATIGIVIVFNILGGSWSEIQWLVAALGVGIGFGLQEIVANFISGLVILFERPIRIGDVVTVGDVDGVVTRIRMRATTIRNWDRKELLVPNKEFITSRLLNWSLSDQITRVLIPVGVAYGTDEQKAMALMAQAAEENERVLPDPPSYVTFEGFGDNALILQLRAFIGSLEHRLAAISELNEAINRKFNDAGIVIAFPQRDLHLDTSGPIDIRIRRDDGALE